MNKYIQLSNDLKEQRRIKRNRKLDKLIVGIEIFTLSAGVYQLTDYVVHF